LYTFVYDVFLFALKGGIKYKNIV